MAQELTREQMLKRAEALYVEAALLLTRLDRKMQRAVKLVLVDGYKPVQAAAMVGRPRQNVHRALARVRERLAEVKAYGK